MVTGHIDLLLGLCYIIAQLSGGPGWQQRHELHLSICQQVGHPTLLRLNCRPTCVSWPQLQVVGWTQPRAQSALAARKA